MKSSRIGIDTIESHTVKDNSVHISLFAINEKPPDSFICHSGCVQLFRFKQSDNFFDNTCPSTKVHAMSSNEYMSLILYSSCNIFNSYPSDVGPNDLGFTCALSKASFLSKLPMSVLILDSTKPCLERKIHCQTFLTRYRITIQYLLQQLLV